MPHANANASCKLEISHQARTGVETRRLPRMHVYHPQLASKKVLDLVAGFNGCLVAVELENRLGGL